MYFSSNQRSCYFPSLPDDDAINKMTMILLEKVPEVEIEMEMTRSNGFQGILCSVLVLTLECHILFC